MSPRAIGTSGKIKQTRINNNNLNFLDDGSSIYSRNKRPRGKMRTGNICPHVRGDKSNIAARVLLIIFLRFLPNGCWHRRTQSTARPVAGPPHRRPAPLYSIPRSARKTAPRSTRALRRASIARRPKMERISQVLAGRDRVNRRLKASP